jgi:N-sulfoglucosamine sulfohydrolase
MSRPNVVLITCHDLGDFLRCYGTPVLTPNLDAMAAQGVVMDRHFSCGSICSPSRGSILTGCYPHTHGLMGLVHRGWELEVAKCPPLPLLLQEVGYETLLFGFQHEHHDPDRLGYQHHVRAPGGLACDHVMPVFTNWLRTRPPDGKPFLASVGFFETHRMGLNPSHFKRDAYDPPDPGEVRVPRYLPDIPPVREDLAGFYGAVNLVDRMIGDVLQTLDEKGLSANTLLIFTTDHGPSFMHAKGTLYDGGTKVALLLRWPGSLPEGLRCPALTSHADLLPTVFDFLDLTLPREVQGVSFAEAARGQTADGRRYVYGEKNYTNYYDPTRMIRSDSFKYIRRGLRTCIFDFVIPELELCPSSFRQNRDMFRFYPAKRCTEELYDLTADPAEMSNLADDPAHELTLDELRSALAEHLAATNDPFRFLRNDLLMPVDGYLT